GAAALGGAIFYLIPGAGLGQRAIKRQEEIRRALPDTMDLLTISVEAGLGFDPALAHVRRNVPGPPPGPQGPPPTRAGGGPRLRRRPGTRPPERPRSPLG